MLEAIRYDLFEIKPADGGARRRLMFDRRRHRWFVETQLGPVYRWRMSVCVHEAARLRMEVAS